MMTPAAGWSSSSGWELPAFDPGDGGGAPPEPPVVEHPRTPDPERSHADPGDAAPPRPRPPASEPSYPEELTPTYPDPPPEYPNPTPEEPDPWDEPTPGYLPPSDPAGNDQPQNEGADPRDDWNPWLPWRPRAPERGDTDPPGFFPGDDHPDATAPDPPRTITVFIYQWRTAGDDRVCPTCGPLDGATFENGDGPHPPAHVGCRCQRVLVATEQRTSGNEPTQVPGWWSSGWW